MEEIFQEVGHRFIGDVSTHDNVPVSKNDSLCCKQHKFFAYIQGAQDRKNANSYLRLEKAKESFLWRCLR